MQTYTNIDPDRLAICPVCGTNFEQSDKGRNRIYCSDKCKIKAFRYAQSVTKCTNEERQAIIKKHISIGIWRYSPTFPEWPKYCCLACNTSIIGPACYPQEKFATKTVM